MNPMFITVEGPIGIGKTSLARAISKRFDLHLLEEIVDENPFLGKFYQNIEEWSFQTEMFFLCNRFKQLQDVTDHYLTQGKPVAADYNIFKNTIFARRSLRADHLPKYLQIYDILTADMPEAGLVVYLTGSLETLMRRIAMRNRNIEQNMDRAYMERLVADYEAFMHLFQQQHPHTQVLTIACDELDYVHNSGDLAHVLGLIEPYVLPGKGKEG